MKGKVVYLLLTTPYKIKNLKLNGVKAEDIRKLLEDTYL